ncbi:MAG: hypothetical protein IJY10_06560 [Lachnospiraceae bacterium]|nr:hypothetical protein [Lachnospiraceae bacterium]MBQ9123137.1 hypothetical protein [Lachnospiraceae bacterium]
MKKLVALLLSAAMVVSMAACGSEKTPDPVESQEPSSSVVESTTESSSEVEELKVEEFVGEFTFQDSVSTLCTNWNPHTYQTTDDSYLSGYINLGFYGMVFNDELHEVEGKDPFTGYKFIPEMAASLPVDVTEQVKAEHPEFNIPESATAGYAYTIDLNPNATWEDGTKITADDYVYSMQQLLDPKKINYRAADYYSSDFIIAGAEGYANSGTTIMKVNSSDGETGTYEIADLVLGEDGIFYTPEGYKVVIALNDAYERNAGYTWDELCQMGYVQTEVNDALKAADADGDGYVEATQAMLDEVYKFIGSDNWGNEAQEYLRCYISYEFSYPEVDFSTVGLYKSGDYQITLVLAKALSGFNLNYSLTSNWLVHKDLYESCQKWDGDAYSTTYNTSVETTKSYGPYKLVSYQQDKALRLERNENWYGYTDGQHIYVDPTDGLVYPMYQTTAIDCEVVAEAATRKLMFLKGELMGYGLQAEDFDTYRNSDYCYATPGSTIFFLILNGHMEAINSREAADNFDQSKTDLQTMTLTSFHQAMGLTYDKDLFAATVSPARSGGFGLIGEAYVYDPETGSRYRDTDQAKQALCDIYSVDVTKFSSLDEAVDSITGYDPEMAKVYFKQAFDEAIAAGYITDTDANGVSDQTVQIEYCLSADSDFMTKTIDYLNEKVNEATAGTPFEGKVLFVKSAPYGNDWSNKIRAGLSDTVLGGWSGSTLNPFSLTDLYVNPSKMYDAAWFDATTVSATMTIAGKEITMNLKEWSDALNGTTVTVDGVDYNFGEGIADVEDRLTILAGFEKAILGQYNYLPVLQDGSMALVSQQIYYVVEDYNPVMGRGGLAYHKYNYNDTEWAEYVASQGGELSY